MFTCIIIKYWNWNGYYPVKAHMSPLVLWSHLNIQEVPFLLFKHKHWSPSRLNYENINSIWFMYSGQYKGDQIYNVPHHIQEPDKFSIEPQRKSLGPKRLGLLGIGHKKRLGEWGEMMCFLWMWVKVMARHTLYDIIVWLFDSRIYRGCKFGRGTKWLKELQSLTDSSISPQG